MKKQFTYTENGATQLATSGVMVVAAFIRRNNLSLNIIMKVWNKIKEAIAGFLRGKPLHYSNKEIIALITGFVLNYPPQGPFDWDDFHSFDLKEPYERFVQRLSCFIECHFKARHNREWCNDEGRQALIRLAISIEKNTLPFPPTEEEEELLKNDKVPLRYAEILNGRK